MVRFVHPARQDITLAGILAALADPARLMIVKSLIRQNECMNCTEAGPCNMAKSTLSNHFRVLREAGFTAEQVQACVRIGAVVNAVARTLAAEAAIS